MLDSETVLQVLESNIDVIPNELGTKWNGFRDRLLALSSGFATVAEEGNPENADARLEMLVNDILNICWDYEYPSQLIDQADRSADGLENELWKNRRPPSPADAPKRNPKEIANKYYSLLAKLEKNTPKKTGASKTS